jgi:uncharacterized protein (UPF0128 family)
MVYQIGDTVTFHVVETDLGERSTGKEYDETGKIELISECSCNEGFTLMARVRISQSRFYVIPLTDLAPAYAQEKMVEVVPTPPILSLKIHKSKPKNAEQPTLFKEI